MSDLIERDAVIEILGNYGCTNREGLIFKDIRALPPVTQKSDEQLYKNGFADGYEQGYKDAEQKSGKWIPVSERLPEDGTYLVTVGRVVGGAGIDIKSFAKDLHKVDEFDFPKHKSGWYDYDSEYGYWQDASVIAWMPLPEPYEPQESEEE